MSGGKGEEGEGGQEDCGVEIHIDKRFQRPQLILEARYNRVGNEGSLQNRSGQ